jgi:Protein of unknown function (DUF2442)
MKKFNNPFIKKIKKIEPYFVDLEFENGEEKRVQMAQFLELPAFQKLKKVDLFLKVKIVDGWSLVWLDEIDLSHDTLYLQGVPISPQMVVKSA